MTCTIPIYHLNLFNPRHVLGSVCGVVKILPELLATPVWEMIRASTAKTIQKRGRQALIRVHPTLRYHCLPRSDNNISRSSRLKSMSKITQSFWIVCAISGISRPCSVQIFACTHFQCSVTSLKLPPDSRNEMFWAFVPTSLFDLPSSRACAPPCPYAYVNRWFTSRQQQERIDQSILMM
jgi:hypothetical protein